VGRLRDLVMALRAWAVIRNRSGAILGLSTEPWVPTEVSLARLYTHTYE
jgi:hypothetical protein